jgi:hypothetical protein
VTKSRVRSSPDSPLEEGGFELKKPIQVMCESCANPLFSKICGAVHTPRHLARLALAGDDDPSEFDFMEPAKTPHQNLESMEGSRKCQIKNDGSMRSSTFSGYRATRPIEISLEG